jgi:hypothetical protein
MDAKLDGLAVDACVAIVKYMHAARFTEIHAARFAYVDVHHLASWYNRQSDELAQSIMADDVSVRSCMGYEHFYKQICAVRPY